jgi:hypothetical protein
VEVSEEDRKIYKAESEKVAGFRTYHRDKEVHMNVYRKKK